MLLDLWQIIEPHLWQVILVTIGGAVVGVFLIWLIRKVVIALAYSVVGSTALLLGSQMLLLGLGIKVFTGWSVAGILLGRIWCLSDLRGTLPTYR